MSSASIEGSSWSRYARIWTPRATPRGSRAGRQGWPGQRITSTFSAVRRGKEDELRRKCPGRLGPAGMFDRGGAAGRDGVWIERNADRLDPGRPANREDGDANLHRSRGGPAEPDRLGGLRRRLVGEAVHGGEQLQGERQVRRLVRRDGEPHEGRGRWPVRHGFRLGDADLRLIYSGDVRPMNEK